jgi:hypothetical protein
VDQPAPAIVAGNPWSPTTIAVLTLVFSPVVGGVLHGLNCGKLGQKASRRFVLSRNLLAGALLILLALSFAPMIGVSLFFASYFYKSQEECFESHRAQGGKKGSLLMAILVSLLVTIPVMLLAFALPH